MTRRTTLGALTASVFVLLASLARAGEFVVLGDGSDGDVGIADPQPVIMAGAYFNGNPPDGPQNRVDANTTSSAFAGVGSLGINGVFTATAVPVTRRHIVTAGHAVDVDNDGLIDVSPAELEFHLNFGGNSTHIIGAAGIALHPRFTGFNNPALNDDVAVVTLASDIPSGVPIYNLCERPMQQGDILTLVGYGRSGWGDLGFRLPLESFSVKRVGQNLADLSFLDDEARGFPEVYVFDFDGPDESTNMLRGPTLGNDIETTLGFGDSGGPAFIWDDGQYKLAGVNTFIARFTGRPFPPPLFGSAGGGIMVFPLGQWIAEQAGLTWDANTLKLDVQGTPVYLQPGDNVGVDMKALNLAQRVNGVQAFLNFSSAHFGTAPGEVNAAPGGGVWDQLIFNMYTVQGDLDVAVGVDLDTTTGTDEDATVAVITLKAAGEGVTQIVFRPDADPDPGLVQTTMFSDENSLTVLPTKVDSQTIVIDGTPPQAFLLTADPTCTATTTELTFSTTDDLAGIDDYELFVDTVSQGMVTSPHSLDMSNHADGDHTVVVRAYDKAGNYTDSPPATVTVDKIAPVISNIVAEQGSGNSALCPHVAVQGVVDLHVDVVDDGCADLAVPPTVTVAGMAPVTYIDVSGDSYHYQVTVLSTTTNGAHTITVNAADDLGNSSMDNSQSICVDKNQIDGTVSMDTFSAVPYGFDRDVVFKATNGLGIVLKTWTVTVSFTNDTGTKVASGLYTLTQVPTGVAGLSAKTTSSLRRKRNVSVDADRQASVGFTGNDKLRGGDIDASNSVNILDYSVLRVNWFGANPIVDVNGDGQVQVLDYAVMKSHWFEVGDPE